MKMIIDFRDYAQYDALLQIVREHINTTKTAIEFARNDDIDEQSKCERAHERACEIYAALTE